MGHSKRLQFRLPFVAQSSSSYSRLMTLPLLTPHRLSGGHMCRRQREDEWHVSCLVTDCHPRELHVKMVMPTLLCAPPRPFLDRLPASNCVKKSREKLGNFAVLKSSRKACKNAVRFESPASTDHLGTREDGHTHDATQHVQKDISLVRCLWRERA